MSLTRKMLKALGLEDDKIEQIIEAHTEVTDALKSQLKEAQDGAESLAAVTKERDKLQAKITDLEAKAPDAAKVQAEFDAYKAQVDGEKANVQKVTLLADALKAAGVARDSAVKALLKVADVSTASVADGKLENAETIIAALKTEYPDFFGTQTQQGVPPVTPPNGGNSTGKEAFLALSLVDRMRYANDHAAEVAGYMKS